jgi:hypothetical protein
MLLYTNNFGESLPSLGFHFSKGGPAGRVREPWTRGSYLGCLSVYFRVPRHGLHSVPQVKYPSLESPVLRNPQNNQQNQEEQEPG